MIDRTQHFAQLLLYTAGHAGRCPVYEGTKEIYQGILPEAHHFYAGENLKQVMQMMPRNSGLFGHSLRTMVYQGYILGQLGFDEEHIVTGCAMGFYHDLGKLLIPSALLCTPRKYNLAERSIASLHTQFGAQAGYVGGLPPEIIEGIRYHHMDYLKLPGIVNGRAKAIAALGAADACDAFLSERPYKTAMRSDDAIFMLKSEKKDPQAIRVLERMLK